MTIPFLRLLKSDNKEFALTSSIASIRSGTPDLATVFRLDPTKFAKVPNSPFAYWVDDEIRELFTKLPPFESEGRTVRVGLQTSDDFRFVRAWWEVPVEHRLDAGNGPDWRVDLSAFQAWCRKRTHESKYWAPFAKGGEYSPYYADIHLVIDWKDEGQEMKAWADPLYSWSGWSRIIKSTEFYFRPGVTWPLRAHTFCPQVLPGGSIFSVRGYSFFDEPLNLLYDLGMTATPFFDALFKTLLGRAGYPEFIVGILQALPYPANKANILEDQGQKHYLYERDRSTKDESQIFYSGEHEENVFAEGILKDAIDQAVADDYSISKVAASKIAALLDMSTTSDNCSDNADVTERESEFSMSEYMVGISWGRFDSRIARDHSLVPALPDPFDPLPVCPPAMLVGTDGLPARADNIASEAWLRARPNAITLPPEPARSQKISAADYPLDIPWDGILVDDPDDPRDIVARLRAALRYLHGAEADDKERVLCAELEVTDLREYLRKPSLFFDTHLKRYSKSRRKAPIYWPLQTRDGRYTIWLYYPRISADTLYGCSNMLGDKLKLERRKLELARVDLAKSESKADRLTVEILVDFVAALEEMKEELDRVAGFPFKPDLDDGVQITASPLWRLFRLPAWQKELKATWEKLGIGDYDWAHLAFAVWPERVRGKCVKDRSLAIAHGLESICEQKAPEAKATGKKRGRKTAVVPPSGLEFMEEE